MQKFRKNQGKRKANWELRLASEKDISAIESLIPLSVRALQAAHYSTAQMDAAIGPVFGVDRQLIQDGTYFVAVGRMPSRGVLRNFSQLLSHGEIQGGAGHAAFASVNVVWTAPRLRRS